MYPSATGVTLSACPRDVGMMSEFETVLRSQIDGARRTLDEARQVGHDYEAHLHAARIRDLLDMAANHEIDTRDWVDPALLDAATLGN